MRILLKLYAFKYILTGIEIYNLLQDAKSTDIEDEDDDQLLAKVNDFSIPVNMVHGDYLNSKDV